MAPIENESDEQLREQFLRSYNDYKSYPNNLIISSALPTTLTDYRRRLDDASRTLFREDQSSVAFREFDALGRGECLLVEVTRSE